MTETYNIKTINKTILASMMAGFNSGVRPVLAVK